MSSTSALNTDWPTRTSPAASCRTSISCWDSPSRKLFTMAFCIEYQALEAVSQQQSAPVRFSLGYERKEDVSHLRLDAVLPKETQSFGEIEHLGNGRRFFELVAAQ